MKMKLTWRIVATFLAITTALLFSILSTKAEDAHKNDEAHDHGNDKVTDEKVRCAIDGMMMKALSMVKVEHDGKAYYFCNSMQVKMFKANPEKYLQTISLGHLIFDLNLLTIDEYREMMTHMKMEGMIKADEIKGKTHYFSIYPMQNHEEIALGDVKLVLQVTNAEGKTKMALLKYSKMTRTYEGFIDMPKGEKHEVRIRVTSPAVKISL